VEAVHEQKTPTTEERLEHDEGAPSPSDEKGDASPSEKKGDIVSAALKLDLFEIDTQAAAGPEADARAEEAKLAPSADERGVGLRLALCDQANQLDKPTLSLTE
jgi:hypothetical protein